MRKSPVRESSIHRSKSTGRFRGIPKRLSSCRGLTATRQLGPPCPQAVHKHVTCIHILKRSHKEVLACVQSCPLPPRKPALNTIIGFVPLCTRHNRIRTRLPVRPAPARPRATARTNHPTARPTCAQRRSAPAQALDCPENSSWFGHENVRHSKIVPKSAPLRVLRPPLPSPPSCDLPSCAHRPCAPRRGSATARHTCRRRLSSTRTSLTARRDVCQLLPPTPGPQTCQRSQMKSEKPSEAHRRLVRPMPLHIERDTKATSKA